jgi:hypothetical protein
VEKLSGGAQAINEDWNGASWSEVADLNTARYYANGAGSTTAGLASGGNTASTDTATEEWNAGKTVKTVDTD